MDFDNIIKRKLNNLKEEDLLVYLQVFEPMAEGLPKMAEALVRLKLDDSRVVAPGTFFNKLTKEQKIWLDFTMIKKIDKILSLENFIDIFVGVNFSKETISYLEENIEKCFSNELKNKDRIIIEITEDVILSKGDLLINKVKNKCFKVALDDYPSNLTFDAISDSDLLKKIDILKLDRQALSADPEGNIRFLKPIYDFARSVFDGMMVIEGVENEKHIAAIEQFCDLNNLYIQGYYYSKPVYISESEHKFIKKP